MGVALESIDKSMEKKYYYNKRSLFYVDKQMVKVIVELEFG